MASRKGRQKEKQWLRKYYTENKRLNNMNPTKHRGEHRISGRISKAVPVPLVAPVVLLENDKNIIYKA
jgi:hypothetical protein